MFFKEKWVALGRKLNALLQDSNAVLTILKGINNMPLSANEPQEMTAWINLGMKLTIPPVSSQFDLGFGPFAITSDDFHATGI